jgi:hypothetical protein
MAVLVATPSPARAQYGMGYGMGMGWGWGIGMGVGPSPSTQLLNDLTVARAAAGRQGPRSNNVYAGNPNAYYNRIRDNGFVSHYDVRRRRPPSYQPGRTASLANGGRAESSPAQPPAPSAAVRPLGDFFDASLRLVWPHESPSDGEHKEKRDLSDQASLAVLKETKQQGAASITSAADARQRLVDYGRPALRQLREAATPPIADSFHRFLLSLYDSLEAAAGPPETSASPSP